MNIADNTEECYKEPKRKVEQILREQYKSCLNVFSIFDQLQPIITEDLKSNVQGFMKQANKSKYEYFKIANELKNYKELCSQIPKKVSFPLFCIL